MRTRAPQHAPGRARPRTSHRVHVRVRGPRRRSSGPRASDRARVVWAGRCAVASGRGAIRFMSASQARGILTPSRVPPQHMIGTLSDENHSASAQVDTIDEDDVMTLMKTYRDGSWGNHTQARDAVFTGTRQTRLTKEVTFPRDKAEKSPFQQHAMSILIVGLNQLKYRLSRTRKPKSHPSSNTQCPITPKSLFQLFFSFGNTRQKTTST